MTEVASVDGVRQEWTTQVYYNTLATFGPTRLFEDKNRMKFAEVSAMNSTDQRPVASEQSETPLIGIASKDGHCELIFDALRRVLIFDDNNLTFPSMMPD